MPNPEKTLILNANRDLIRESLENRIPIEILCNSLGVSDSFLRRHIKKDPEMKEIYLRNKTGYENSGRKSDDQIDKEIKFGLETAFFVKELEHNLPNMNYQPITIILLSKSLAYLEKNVMEFTEFTNESRNAACSRFLQIVINQEEIPAQITDEGVIYFF